MVFVGYGSEQDQSRSAGSVVLLLQRVPDEFRQILLEFVQPGFTGKCFVVAKEGEDDVCLDARQPVIRTAEVGRTQPLGQLVTREAKVSNHEIVPGKAAVQHGLQPAVVLHPLGQGIADDGNAVALVKD